MSDITLRPATLKDAAILADLQAASLDPAWDEAAMRGFLRQNAPAILLIQDGEAAGFALARIAADEAELLSIAVSLPVRNQGHGRALLLALCERLEKTGVKTLFLEVASDNKTACLLYENFGFIRMGRRVKYYTNGDDALTYRRVLR